MPIPTKFDHDIEAISGMANSIICKLGIMKRTGWKTSPTGNLQIKRAPTDVELRALREMVQMFADAVLEMAHSE